jgi:hypothetical protein
MKKGKGRPKGYKPFIDITYEELGQWVGPKAIVKVNTKWLDFLKGNLELDSEEQKPNNNATIVDVDEIAPPIEYNLTNFNDE